MKNLQRTYEFITTHPLGSKHPIRAMSNWVGWQVKSRCLPGPHAVPFIEHTRLMVSRGMHGATGNIYCGLHEFEDMAFVMHFLQPSDLFVDVGANIGSYTVIASGVCGAHSIAIEPFNATAEALAANIELNHLQKLVYQESSAIGDKPGTVRFSTELDCMNRVLDESEHLPATEVSQTTLDDLLLGKSPTVLKIDVEGFEMSVLRGGQKILAYPGLQVLIIELNGSGRRYGVEDSEIVGLLQSFDFEVCSYNPFNRKISQATGRNRLISNALFIRNIDFAEQRVKLAPKRRVLGQIF